tara:strand:+ start:310 stop:459 length:150 start_codon:yes stop_codon:yes gene_type:complete
MVAVIAVQRERRSALSPVDDFTMKSGMCWKVLFARCREADPLALVTWLR